MYLRCQLARDFVPDLGDEAGAVHQQGRRLAGVASPHRASAMRPPAGRPKCAAGWSSGDATRILQDHRGALFGDHRRRGVGIARGDGRHHGGIDHAKPGDAMKAQPLIDHGHGIARRAHLRGADGMEDRGADIAGGLRQRGIVVADRRAGQEFLG